jgi:hypothetical protein
VSATRSAPRPLPPGVALRDGETAVRLATALPLEVLVPSAEVERCLPAVLAAFFRAHIAATPVPATLSSAHDALARLTLDDLTRLRLTESTSDTDLARLLEAMRRDSPAARRSDGAAGATPVQA